MDQLVPENLREIYKASFSVQRYKVDYYPEAICDWTGYHIDRCRMMARTINLPRGIDREKLEMILLLHDLPEVGEIKDVTSIDKAADPALALATDSKEVERAKLWFNAEQLALYEDFERAKKYLKDGGNIDFSPEALIARLIEQTDGNTTYHCLWSKWVKGKEWKANFIMPEKAALYTFKQYDDFKNKLQGYPNEEVGNCGMGVLDRQINLVKACWTEVEKKIPERMPKILVKEIDG